MSEEDGIPMGEFRQGQGHEPEHSTWEFSGYDREIVARVWKFASTVEGNDPELWRKDEFGAWIQRLDYGNRHSEFGWEVCDTSLGRGEGGIVALRPMQWQNYVDHVAAVTQSKITADGLRNIRRLF
ncbi:MAG: hypothetical protein ACR2RV_06120 [Verrucomicrobiales bacterium]